MRNGLAERAFSIGLWAWLMIVEKEAEKLSDNGRVALKLLREDLEKLATNELPAEPHAAPKPVSIGGSSDA